MLPISGSPAATRSIGSGSCHAVGLLVPAGDESVEARCQAKLQRLAGRCVASAPAAVVRYTEGATRRRRRSSSRSRACDAQPSPASRAISCTGSASPRDVQLESPIPRAAPSRGLVAPPTRPANAVNTWLSPPPACTSRTTPPGGTMIRVAPLGREQRHRAAGRHGQRLAGHHHPPERHVGGGRGDHHHVGPGRDHRL